MKKTVLVMTLVGLLSIGGIFNVFASDSSAASSAEAGAAKALSVQITPEHINDIGNVKLPVSRKEMEDAGYSFGDMLTVTIDDQAIDLPFGSSYSDVDSGCPVLVCRDDEEDVVDLLMCAEEYLAGIGMCSEDIEALEKNLSADAEALRLAA